ncbi:MAG: hypothetical protein QHH09_04145 [Microgenomates group bacterium]|nr:hypothetical protein [Microgenomates group bacterium]
MSRLLEHQKKQFTQRIIFFFLFVLVLLIFFFVYGFKLIINSGLFLGSFFSRQAPTDNLNKKDFFYGSINVDDIPSATNSAKINIRGTVENFDLIQFYLNGENIKQTENIFPDNTFSEEIDGLQPGNNEIFLVATNKSLNKNEKTQIYNVFFKNSKPQLIINQPSDQSKISEPEIKVVGQTDKETFVKINNLPAVVDSQGIFQSSIKLQEGENKIEIIAEDIAGNVEVKTLTVYYEKND